MPTRRSIVASASTLIGASALTRPVEAKAKDEVTDSERHRLIEERITRLGIDLGVSKPGGSYAAVIEEGATAQVSGMVPALNGQVAVLGRVGAEVSLEEAQYAARISTLRCLAALKTALGDFGRIRRVTKMTVYIQAAPGFHQLSEVSNGASDTLNDVLAPFGEHARTSVGAFALPRNAVLELDMTVAIDPRP